MAQLDGTRKIAQVRGRSFAEQVLLQHDTDKVGHGPTCASGELLQGAMLLGREVDGQARARHDIMISPSGCWYVDGFDHLLQHRRAVIQDGLCDTVSGAVAKSFRLDPEHERRLEQAAARAGVSISVFIREAVQQRCDAVLGRSLLDELGETVGAVESGRLNARKTGRAFTDLLSQQRERRRQRD